MAKASMIAREKRRMLASERSKVSRQALKKIINNPETDYDEKMAAVEKLNKRPRDQSAVRVQKRCRHCGRPHAVYRKFAMCRICLRIAMMNGWVPGLVKSSW